MIEYSLMICCSLVLIKILCFRNDVIEMENQGSDLPMYDTDAFVSET